MPRYTAKEPGFFEGSLYAPNSKRPVVVTSKPLKPVPTWLERIPDETAAQAKARLKKEKAETKKAAEDKKDIEAVSFIDGPEGADVGASDAVMETL